MPRRRLGNTCEQCTLTLLLPLPDYGSGPLGQSGYAYRRQVNMPPPITTAAAAMPPNTGHDDADAIGVGALWAFGPQVTLPNVMWTPPPSTPNRVRSNAVSLISPVPVLLCSLSTRVATPGMPTVVLAGGFTGMDSPWPRTSTLRATRSAVPEAVGGFPPAAWHSPMMALAPMARRGGEPGTTEGIPKVTPSVMLTPQSPVGPITTVPPPP